MREKTESVCESVAGYRTGHVVHGEENVSRRTARIGKRKGIFDAFFEKDGIAGEEGVLIRRTLFMTVFFTASISVLEGQDGVSRISIVCWG